MIRTTPFLRAYRYLPHGAINGACARAARVTEPKWLVDAAVDAWVKKDGIDLGDFEPKDYTSLEDFFLRRLKPGARPVGEDFVSPVDGTVVGSGPIERDTVLQVKGRPLSVERLVNGTGHHDLDLSAYDGGTYATLFLRPKGYHFVHAPARCEVVDVRWISGRFFPQNEDALRVIDRIYERNERAVLRLRLEGGLECLLVMVGASVVGGIHVNGIDDVKRPAPIPVGRSVEKGEEIGHFTFGSTVVVLWPRGAASSVDAPLGRLFNMGERLARVGT